MARAQYGATARSSRPLAATNEVDPTASGTAIGVEDRPFAGEQASEVLREVPGLRVVNTGAYGAFSGLTLRGAELGQTSVLFGNLPISSADRGAFDFSTIPLHALEQIEVYRGGAPVWLSMGAIGGVVRLVPASAERTSASAAVSAGSLGYKQARLSASVAEGGTAVSSFASLTDSDGDIRTLVDCTSWDRSEDDGVRRIRNAQATDGHGMLHIEQKLGAGQLELAVLGFGRHAGVPGTACVNAARTRRHQARIYGVTGYSLHIPVSPHGERSHRLQIQLGGAYERHRYADPFGELGDGGPQSTDDRFGDGFGRLATTLSLLPALDLTVIASARLETFHPHDALSSDSQADFSRRRFAIATESRLHGRIAGLRAELRPSVRVELSQASLYESRLGHTERQPGDFVLPTYRLAGLVEPLPGVALSVSAASGQRLPGVLELFGDGETLEANPSLSPEHAKTIDASLVLQGKLGLLRGTLELRGFAFWIDDLIRRRAASTLTVVAENEAAARIQGAELGIRGALGRHVHLAAALTAMHAENQHGRPLPYRPDLQGYVRPELRAHPDGLLDRLSGFVDLTHVGANHTTVPRPFDVALAARTRISVGTALAAWRERVELQLRVTNLMDERFTGTRSNTDLLGYPLPGRMFFATLILREEG